MRKRDNVMVACRNHSGCGGSNPPPYRFVFSSLSWHFHAGSFIKNFLSMYPPLVVKNWNGMYLNDCFRLIKPISDKHVVGAVFEVKEELIDGVSLGFAKIVTVNRIEFKNINDSLSFSIINKPAPYLKSVLQKIYPIKESDLVHLMNLQWTERILEAHRAIMHCHWDKIVKQTPHGTTSPFQQLLF
jgi:hypothetical protein